MNKVTEKWERVDKEAGKEETVLYWVILYTYDLQDAIIRKEGSDGVTDYVYNALNQQVEVTDSRNGVQRNVYDPERLRAGLEENGEFSRFVFHQGEVLTEEAGDLALKTRFVRGYGVEACQQNGQMYYYQKDEQFSTLLVSNAGQGVENVYQYDAFGGVTRSKEGIQNRITYTGQQYDGVTEQYYLRARYYNPVLGRFLQEDEYRGDGLNLYAYCGNNPVGYFDSSGYKQDANNSCKKKQKQVNGDGGGVSEDDLPGRSGAFKEAKRDAKIPQGQQPEKVEYEYMRTAQHEGNKVIVDTNGKPIETREYYYTNSNGDKIVIQDHSAGHEKGGQGSHFHVRPAENTRTGKVEGTKEHYPFRE